MSTIIAWSLVAIMAIALARCLVIIGKKTAEVRRLEDEVEALKDHLDIAASRVDPVAAYDGLREYGE